MLRFLIILSFLTVSFLVNSQTKTVTYLFDENAEPRERFVDFTHLKAELWFEPKEGKVWGTVVHTFTPLRNSLDSLFFDAPQISVQKVTHYKQQLKFKTNAQGVWVYFQNSLNQTEHQLEITYEAFPKKGLYFIGWNDPNNLMPKQIWTQGQGIDNRHWLPCFDDLSDKITTEMIIHFDADFQVISNGKLLKHKNESKTTATWHYKLEKPHAPYLIMLAIGKYEMEERKSNSGVSVKLYYYPEHKNRVAQTYRQSTEMIDFMENFTGVPYPWNDYKQVPVANFLYGAMENTTATIFGDFFMVDERAALDREYLDVNAHELAHQWFGNLVTARSGPHHWLQESFATYFQMLFTKQIKGDDFYRFWMRENALAAFKSSATDLMGVGHSMAGSNRHYLKGAYVLDMLQYVVGNDMFKKAIQHYLNTYAFKNVETDDFMYAFHEVTGHNLYWFFDQWIKRGGEPTFEVDFYEKINDNQKQGVFLVKQTHDINELLPVFKMPIMFQVFFNDGSIDSTTVFIEKQTQEVVFNLPQNKEINFVLFDPNSKILKQCNFNKPFKYLEQQALYAPNFIDRYDAVQALSKYDYKKKEKLFNSLATTQKFQAIKAEMAIQLLAEMNKESFVLLKKLAEDSDPKVAKAILMHTPYIPKELLSMYEAFLQAQSYEVIEMALHVLYRMAPLKMEQYLEQTKHIEGIKAKNVRITWLEIAYNETKDIQLIDELIGYTSNSYEFLTILKAQEALQNLDFFNETYAKHLMQAVCSYNGRLKRPSSRILKSYFQKTAYRNLILKVYFENIWTETERKAIEAVLT